MTERETKAIMSSLNKLSNSNKDKIILDLKRVMKNVTIEEKPLIQQLIDILFKKSMNEENHIDLFAEVCFELAKDFHATERSQLFVLFYTSLIHRYQQFFEEVLGEIKDVKKQERRSDSLMKEHSRRRNERSFL